MSKIITSFSCTNCSFQSAKWFGCCPECNEWNSFVEKSASVFGPKNQLGNAKQIQMLLLKDAANIPKKRLFSGFDEWDRVLGSGIRPGSFLILTGDPGIGKSTLLLQIANKLANKHKVFYFSSEESLEQVKQRAA